MAIWTKKARKVLTKKEQRHLTDAGINTIGMLKIQIEHQQQRNPEQPGKVCWECWFIARKLDLIREDRA
jgi:hypothetical protein